MGIGLTDDLPIASTFVEEFRISVKLHELDVDPRMNFGGTPFEGGILLPLAINPCRDQ